MSKFYLGLKIFLVSVVAILHAAHAEDLIADNFSRDFKLVSPLPVGATIGGYPVYQGGRTWHVLSGKVHENNVRLKISYVNLVSPMDGGYFAEMNLANSLNQSNSYFISEPCANSHLVKLNKGGGNYDNCLTIDPYAARVGDEGITTLSIKVRNSQRGSRLYDLRILLNLAYLGFPQTSINDWTEEAIAGDPAKKKLLEKVRSWAQLLQDGVDKANAYSKPRDAFEGVPPIDELLAVKAENAVTAVVKAE